MTLEIDKGNECSEFYAPFRGFAVVGTRTECVEVILPLEGDVLVGFTASANDMVRYFCV